MWARAALALLQAALVCSQAVIQLTPETFASTIRESSLMLVNFYAPWCGHCQSLKGVLENVAKDLPSMGINAIIAQIDASTVEAAGLADQEGVGGFPSLMLFARGHRLGEYHGSRDETQIMSFLRRKSRPAAEYVSALVDLVPTLSQLEAGAFSDAGVLCVVVGVFVPTVHRPRSPAVDVFHAAAARFDAGLFFVTDSRDVADHFQIERDTVVVYTGAEHEAYHRWAIPEGASVETLLQAVLALAQPASLPFVASTLPLLDALPVQAHALAFYDSSGTDDRFLSHLLQAMSAFKGRILMVEVASEEYALMNHFDIRLDDLPQLLLVDRSAQALRYSFAEFLATQHEPVAPSSPETFDPSQQGLRVRRVREQASDDFLFAPQDLHRFFEHYLSGRLRPTLRSDNESVAAQLNSEASAPQRAISIVGAQFESLVLGPADQTALVYFHAPWCIHCKLMDTVIADVADHYAGDPRVAVFRIDGSRNEVHHPQVAVTGFPAVYLFKAFAKERALLFDGERSLMALLQFVEGPNGAVTEVQVDEHGEATSQA